MMKKGRVLYAAALMLAGSLTVVSCGKKVSSETAPADTASEAGVVFDTTLSTDVTAAENSDGTVDDGVDVVAPDNQSKDGYTTTASGLKYKVIKKGQGTRPTATSTVKVKYTGKLEDGSVFDSTDKHGGEPISFPLNRVIPGWTEGLQLMEPGAVYEFIIPSNLAYGNQELPGIPANSTLVFEVELLEVQ